MCDTSPSRPSSVFRTQAWTQAWLDTWRKDISKGLIDLGGRGNPLEMLYRIPHRFKGIIPASVLCLVGNGFGSLSTPRSEYNNIFDLIAAAGGINTLGEELNRLSWQQMHLTDLAADYPEDSDVRSLLKLKLWGSHKVKEELSYSVENVGFNEYLAKLGGNTRLAFFNRRARLEKHGRIERQQYPLGEANKFFSLLNNFHIHRWGRPCYSTLSMTFLQNFCQRLSITGGESIFETIMIDGQSVSALFDVIWQGRRYNLQSGYSEYFDHKIALGSLHLGYAIEEALNAEQDYDFLAGQGKRSDYKAKIANCTTPLRSYIATRGYWKLIKNIQSKARSYDL